MTHGLYELIGADRASTSEALQKAYARTVAQLVRRRKALVEQGGDTRRLDLARSQVDEAWDLLSDPARRRRYDALLGMTEGGDVPDAPALWERVAGSLASPAAAAAAELVAALTRLDVGGLPAPTGVPVTSDDVPTYSPDTQADVPTEAFPSVAQVARRMPTPPAVVPFPGAQARDDATPPSAEPRPELRVVDGSPGAAPVVRLPVERAEPPPPPKPAVFDLEASIAELGWSGALLKRVRESKGLSLRDVGDATRISARYLEAIEQDDYALLPSSTFVKGYLREMARTLGLDEAALVRGYMRRMG